MIVFCVPFAISFLLTVSSPHVLRRKSVIASLAAKAHFSLIESIRTSLKPIRVDADCTAKAFVFHFYISLFNEHQIARYISITRQFRSRSVMVKTCFRLSSSKFERVTKVKGKFPRNAMESETWLKSFRNICLRDFCVVLVWYQWLNISTIDITQ